MKAKNYLKKSEKLLTNRFFYGRIPFVKRNATMAQSVAHVIGNDEVISSNLISSSKDPEGESNAFGIFV